MIFGYTHRFAIEFQLDDNYQGSWLFGKLWCWAGRQRIGDYQLGTSLRDALYSWQRISCDAGKRRNDNLYSMNTLELGHTLYCGLYGYGCDESEWEKSFKQGLDDEWANHDILPTVDVFDHWHGFLVESTDKARLIICQNGQSNITEYMLDCGEFDRVLSSVLHELTPMSEREEALEAAKVHPEPS